MSLRSVTPLLVVIAGASALGLSACATDGQVAAGGTGGASTSVPSSPRTDPSVGTGAAEATKAPSAQPAQVLPAAHVHAVSREPTSGELLVATHEGLYVYGQGGSRKVGPNIDLMGFTVAGPRHYYASGHPGPGVDLPQPAGLLESRDGGKTWTVLSRGGSSDFHALTANPQRVIAFDGTVRTTTDGRTWTTGDLASPPRTLTMGSDGRRALATTADGLMSSDDGGVHWTPVKGAPLLLLVDWAEGQTVAGLTPQGHVHLSTDAGRTWRATEATADPAHALDAAHEGDSLEVTVATADLLLTSLAGQPFDKD